MDLIFHAQFIASKVGKTGLSGTNMVQIYRTTRSDGTTSQVVTNGTATETAKGVYRYRLADADLTLYDYVGVFVTADATVDQQEVPALWGQYAGEANVEQISGDETAANNLESAFDGTAPLATAADLLKLLLGNRTRFFDRTRGPASNYTLSTAEVLDLIAQNTTRGGTIHVIRSGDNLETSLAGGAQYDVWLVMPGAYSVTEATVPDDALIIGVGGSVTIQGGATHPFASGTRLTIAGIGGAVAITGTHLAPTAGMTLYNCAVTGGDYGVSSDNVSWNAWNCTFSGALNGVLIASDAVTVNLYGCNCTATPASDLECAAAKIAGSGVLSIYGGTMTATQYSGGSESAYAAVNAVLYGVTDASTSGTSGCTVYASVDDDPLQQLLGDVDGSVIEDRVTTARAGYLDAAVTAQQVWEYATRTLTSGAAPSAGDIADAVWDEALSGHATAGTAGAALSAAQSAGDPWSTNLPGAYAAGTAGYIISNISSIATATKLIVQTREA